MFGFLRQRLRRVRFRGKHRLLDALTPRRGEVRISLFGAEFVLDLAEDVQRSIYFGSFEPRETDIVAAHLRPGMTVVDVGAHVGYYTALAAERVGPAGRVIAIDPSPYVLARLRRMVASSGLRHVAVLPVALSDAEGEALLHLGLGARNHAPTLVAHGHTQTTPVKTRTLDALATELGLEQVDLLKLDVEGWEPQVLRGAARLLEAGRVGAVLCEVNEPWVRAAGSSAAQLVATLREAGFVERARIGNGVVQNRFLVLP